MAMLDNLKLDAPQKTSMEIIPDPTPRYQSRSMYVTAGNNSKNVVALTIQKLVISSALVSKINGTLNAAVTCENLPGPVSATTATYSFNRFTKKSSIITTQGFKVVDAIHSTSRSPLASSVERW
jgi:hypothetical protein